MRPFATSLLLFTVLLIGTSVSAQDGDATPPDARPDSTTGADAQTADVSSDANDDASSDASAGSDAVEAAEGEAVEVPRPPWHFRYRQDTTPNRQAMLRVSPDEFPPDPGTPTEIDPAQFMEAFKELCGWIPRHRAERYAPMILENAARFQIDPFLLAALIHRMSRCRADAEGLNGVGLALIDRHMHYRHLRDGKYSYFVLEGNEWKPRELDLSEHVFSGFRLLRARESIYFAAGILKVLRDQQPSLARAFDQPPYRHYVSHFIWGDRVRSHRTEDKILTDRRRMLLYYGAIQRVPPITRLGVSFGCPLDACPRVISSFPGDERDGGARRHKGIDLESAQTEPVRAMAAGRVSFSGIDVANGASRSMRTRDTNRARNSEMGRGGRFICILHPREGQSSLRTCYMHLRRVNVQRGDHVTQGQLIGSVGRSGMRESAAHLHLELHENGRRLNPADHFRGILLGRPPEERERRRNRRRGRRHRHRH